MPPSAPALDGRHERLHDDQRWFVSIGSTLRRHRQDEASRHTLLLQKRRGNPRESCRRRIFPSSVRKNKRPPTVCFATCSVTEPTLLTDCRVLIASQGTGHLFFLPQRRAVAIHCRFVRDRRKSRSRYVITRSLWTGQDDACLCANGGKVFCILLSNRTQFDVITLLPTKCAITYVSGAMTYDFLPNFGQNELLGTPPSSMAFPSHFSCSLKSSTFSSDAPLLAPLPSSLQSVHTPPDRLLAVFAFPILHDSLLHFSAQDTRRHASTNQKTCTFCRIVDTVAKHHRMCPYPVADCAYS